MAQFESIGLLIGRTVVTKFSIVVFLLCRGIRIQKIKKTPLIYNVSYFNFEGLEAFFREAKTNKAPHYDGTAPGKRFSKTDIEYHAINDILSMKELMFCRKMDCVYGKVCF